VDVCRYDATTGPDATKVFAGVNDPPACWTVTANSDGAGDDAKVNVTCPGDDPITPIETG
jgi:hypothetical protein